MADDKKSGNLCLSNNFSPFTMKTIRYLIEVPFYGNSSIRNLSTTEEDVMKESDLKTFDFWRCNGSDRFWAFRETAENLKKHGFSMEDQYSKDHGCHVSDYVSLGDGVYEYYEQGFEQADALIKQYGSFLYFLPVYSSWGSNGHELLSPISNLLKHLPPYFVNLIASKGLLALSVTSDVDNFLRGYLDYANCLGGDEVRDIAIEMGLIVEN